jgi:helicase MOV-10
MEVVTGQDRQQRQRQQHQQQQHHRQNIEEKSAERNDNSPNTLTVISPTRGKLPLTPCGSPTRKKMETKPHANRNGNGTTDGLDRIDVMDQNNSNDDPSKSLTSEIDDTSNLNNPRGKLSRGSVNAVRFIPEHKRLQWDYIPSMLIAVSPCQQTEVKSAIHHWVHDPELRRSSVDPCTFNLLNHLPEGVRYLQRCHLHSETPSFLWHVLNKYQKPFQALHEVIQNSRKAIQNLESKLSSFADLDIRKKNSSIASIKAQHSRSSQQYDESRVIATTPETLAKVCDEIQSISERGNDVTYGFQATMEIHGCLEMVTRDYLTKMNILIDIERLQAMEDLKAYDMYSCQFEYIEIAPPRVFNAQCNGCRRNKIRHNKSLYCAYHLNLASAEIYKNKTTFVITEKYSSTEERGKAIKASIVSTKEQFQNLPDIMMRLGTTTGEKIIVYLNVPGVAENRPLVCIGDLVRFRFGNVEVIGEVGEVSIKTENVMFFLPIPYDMNLCPEFFQALMYPKNKVFYHDDPNIGRFDVRFGLFGSRAHDVFKETALSASSKSIDQVMRVMAPTPFLDKIQKKSVRRPQIGISEWANTLNMEQKHAVFDILRKNHGQAPYCIYGPPGTGKTMTVVESAFQILRHDLKSKILICAPSDAACDVIATRLLRILPSVCKLKRVNWWSRNPASLPPNLLGCSSMDKSGFFVLPSQEEISNASVIICQCFVAGCLDIGIAESESWMEKHFTHVFIDESSQSFEFESLIPLMKVGKECSIILAGDPKQLGPMVRSRSASRNGLSLSLQERLMGLSLYQIDTNYCVITKLLDNYRSHDALLRVPSELFYRGSLRCKASAKITSTCENFELLRDGQHFPMMVYDVHDGLEKNKIDTPSFYNIRECHTVVKIIRALLASPNVDINTGQIYVITCFRAQVLKLREILRKSKLRAINVGVVEDFQGQETSVVLISTVLTQNQDRWRKEGSLGFMTDPKRFNVAITRASSLCIVVGKVDYLESSGSYWTALIEHVRRNGGISGDDKFITNDEEDKEDYHELDYGINQFIEKIGELNLALGSGHELDRYEMVMQGYYQDSPEWKVCL